ncbi:MAG: PKD domain-containing protein [Saprospiraceae bacterium]|nr:PKD domain-containing protein [Saprospiraceae bacterium]
MKTLAACLCLLWSATLLAQSTTPAPREADFSVAADSQGTRFTAQMPALSQVAGAPEAFYTCFWEFGDGSFSFEENPTHRYRQPGNYTASLDLTNNYDDGKKPKKKRKSVLTGGSGGGTTTAGVFQNQEQGLALKTNSQPKSGEALTCILSYRNRSALTTGGRLHLFFNEKKFPNAHFRYDTARTYFGELADNSYSLSDFPEATPGLDWAALIGAHAGGAGSLAPAEAPFAEVQAMLEQARRHYRQEQQWRFTELRPGEQRNIFVDLSGTAHMLKDTSAFIHLEGVFEPFDPMVAPERFELEIEIVSSHDPNAIFVSDNRVNYRLLKYKNLDYKVRFQNNGEGPAHTVALQIDIPEGLNLARMRPLDWYPECPICPPTPYNGSCLDTASSQDGLLFTFRNIYLPGSRQKGVTDKDSTKGFVTYRIEPESRMAKRSFHSRAQIVFDKNPPIFTNYSKTGFKPGLSPGFKVGHAFPPENSGDGYYFLGLSLSPYKSWKIYPQVELLTGLKGRAALPDLVFRDSVILADATFKRVTYRDSSISAERRFVSFEVPFLLRKNFSRYWGLGIGASARLLLEDGEDKTRVRVLRRFFGPAGTNVPPPELLRDTTTVTPYSATSTRFAAFAELRIGFVRAGPSLGIRAGAVLRKRQAEPFVQIALEMKF